MLHRSVSSLIVLIGVCAAVGSEGKVESEHSSGAVRPSPHSKGGDSGVGQQSRSHTVLVDQIPADQLRPLPSNARLITHYAGGQRSALDAAGDDSEKLIYSNTLGSTYYSPRTAHIRIADDISTEAAADCELRRYLIRVTGGVEDGDGTFDVTVALLDQCPSTLPWDAPAIPGTEVKFTSLLDNEEDIHELVIDYSNPNIGICTDARGCKIDAQDCFDGSACVDGPPVVIPPSVWLRVEFSTDRAGWILGSPPTRGFSADVFDHPRTGCSSWFGGYPCFPHSSFYVEVFATDACETHFVAYRAAPDPFAEAFWSATESFGFADDIELAVDRCELSALEIGTKGNAGRYDIDFDLRYRLEDGAIPGTERRYSSRNIGRGQLEIARFTFEPGLWLDRDFWIYWLESKPQTGVVNVGRTLIGSSRPVFAAYNHPANPGDWGEYFTHDRSPVVADVAVYCRGETPVGACCPNQPDQSTREPVCADDVGVLDCLGQRWLAGATCPAGHNDPNDPWRLLGEPPCGTHACCSPDDNCANLSHEECYMPDYVGYGAAWYTGEFCGEHGFRCPFHACLHGDGPCADGVAWEGESVECAEDKDCWGQLGWEWHCHPISRVCMPRRGCDDFDCCEWVCTADSFCCDVVWDLECAAVAAGCPGPVAGFEESSPRHNGSLWRTKNNVVRIQFDADIAAPSVANVEVNELLQCGFGPDLSASFIFDVEDDTNGDPRILKIRENGSVLRHRTWYAFRNLGNWERVSDFKLHYVVLAGDADGDKKVVSLDVGAINAGIPCFENCGDDNRLDIDGDGRVISLDVGVVNGHIPSYAPYKPPGHGGGR